GGGPWFESRIAHFVSGSRAVDAVAWLEQAVPDPALPIAEDAAAQIRERAASSLEELDELEPEERAWAVARLRSYWMNGNYAEGRARAAQAAAEPGVSALALSRLLEVEASAAFEQGAAAAARQLFRQAIDTAPDDIGRAISLGGLARCELMAGTPTPPERLLRSARRFTAHVATRSR